MATRKKTSGSLLQLKIELAGIKPLIWRRVIVPEAIILAKLHQVIQAVMGSARWYSRLADMPGQS